MKMNSKAARIIILLVALAFTSSLAACVSLASDITPPPGYVPPQPQPTAAPVYPMVPPDPQAGAPIYAEKCAPCHGESGLGDGSQAGALSVSPGVWLYQLTDKGLALELTAKGTKYFQDKDLN